MLGCRGNAPGIRNAIIMPAARVQSIRAYVKLNFGHTCLCRLRWGIRTLLSLTEFPSFKCSRTSYSGIGRKLSRPTGNMYIELSREKCWLVRQLTFPLEHRHSTYAFHPHDSVTTNAP